MIAEELSAIKTYVQELEALRNYPQLKTERDQLAIKAAELKSRVEQLAAQIAEETARYKKTLNMLRKMESRAQGAEHKLTSAERELSALRDFKVKIPDGELSLKELRKQFLRAQVREVEAQVKERGEKLTQEMHSRMPALIEEDLKRVLSTPNWPPEIAKIVSSEATRITDEILRDKQKWPEWFKDYFVEQLEAALARELNEEFQNRVAAEAQKSLETIKTHAWAQYSAAKASELTASLKAMVSQLQGIRSFTCDRCGRRLTLEIGPAEIAQLLSGRTVDVTCSSCADMAPPPFLFSTVPHKVGSIAFADLLRWYLDETPPAN